MGGTVGIRASYWATGGILTLLGLAVARIILGFLGGVAVSVGAALVAAGAFLFKAALILLALWLVLRLVRGRRREDVAA